MNFENVIDNVKKLIVENTEYMKSLEGCGETLRDELKKFNEEIAEMRLEFGETLIHLKTKQQRLNQILENASNDSNTLEEFENKYREWSKYEENKRINVKLTAEYEEFKKQIVGNNLNVKNIDEGEDLDIDDIMETAGNVCSMHDPWTKALMLNPVRNIQCGHHYDHDSVMSVIRSNMSVRCPVIFCYSGDSL